MLSNAHDQTFTLSVKYDPKSSDLSSIFLTLSELIDSFNSIDNNLLKVFMFECRSSYTLEDIRIGSIRAKIRTVLESIDDEGLAELDLKRVIGGFLVKGKHRLLTKLQDKNNITNLEEVIEIEEEIKELAKEAQIEPSIYPYPIEEILKDLVKMSKATSKLREDEEVTYLYGDDEVIVNKKFKIDQEAIDEILTEHAIVRSQRTVVRVKKPDYLGMSMWNVYIDNKSTNVKVIDYEWLSDFQSRRVEVRPGDSLVVDLRIIINVGYNKKPLSIHYEITNVLEIITNTHKQLLIDDY